MRSAPLLLLASVALFGCPKSEPEKTQPTATPSATVEAPKPSASAIVSAAPVDAAKPPAEFKI